MLSSTFRIDITFPSTRRATVLREAMGTKGGSPVHGTSARGDSVALRAVAQEQALEANSSQRYAVMDSNAGAVDRVDSCSQIERMSTKWPVSRENDSLQGTPR